MIHPPDMRTLLRAIDEFNIQYRRNDDPRILCRDVQGAFQIRILLRRVHSSPLGVHGLYQWLLEELR